MSGLHLRLTFEAYPWEVSPRAPLAWRRVRDATIL